MESLCKNNLILANRRVLPTRVFMVAKQGTTQKQVLTQFLCCSLNNEIMKCVL